MNERGFIMLIGRLNNVGSSNSARLPYGDD